MPHLRLLGAPSLALAALCLLACASEAAPAGGTRGDYRAWPGHRRPVARMPARVAPPRQALAAPASAKPPVKPAVKADEAPAVEPSSTWTAAEGERACFRGRRKLWQEGEGWVVKKVSVCP